MEPRVKPARAPVQFVPGVPSKLKAGLALTATFLMIIVSPLGGIPAEAVMKISGNGDALGMVKMLADSYARLHPGRRIEVLPSLGSTGAIEAVARGAIDIGLIVRPLTESERKMGLRAVPFATAPLVFVAYTGSPVDNVSTDDLVKIYTGAMTSWPGDARISHARIRLVLRPANDANTRILRGISPEMDKAVQAALTRQGMLMAVTSQECADLVERTPGAFSTLTLSQVMAEKRAVKVLSYNGVKPTAQAAGSAMTTTFAMVTHTKTDRQEDGFIDFVFSPAGCTLMHRYGALPIRK